MQARVRRDGLAARAAGCPGCRSALREPAPLAVVLDALADDGADGRDRRSDRISAATRTGEQAGRRRRGRPATRRGRSPGRGCGRSRRRRWPAAGAGRRAGRARRSPATRSAVPSVEASSTTTTSSGIARSASTESRARSTVVAAFQVGTRIESRGASGRPDGVALAAGSLNGRASSGRQAWARTAGHAASRGYPVACSDRRAAIRPAAWSGRPGPYAG